MVHAGDLVILVALFLFQKPRHRQDRPGVRAGDGAVVHRDRGPGRHRHRAHAADPGAPSIRAMACAVSCASLGSAFVGAGLGRAGGDGLRGAVCRYGPFRRPRHPLGLAVFRLPGVGAELFRPGRAAADASRRSAVSVLRPGAGTGRIIRWWRWRRVATIIAIAGRDLRRLLHHPPGGAAGPVAADGNPPHHRATETGQIYVPAHQRHAVRRRGADRADLQESRTRWPRLTASR